jgi:peptidoglycan/xylan/chitin deacetylase (PgdA/CDA1 family)
MTKLARILLLVLAFAAPCAAAAPVVLLRSDTTEAFFRANGGHYEYLITPWRDFFARNGIAARELRAEELAAVKEPAVLVLASTVALGDAERDAIRARLAAGWSVLGTWALGVRDGKGEWSGYGFIDELFSARVEPELAATKDESFLLPYGETPLTQRLNAGKRIYLEPTREPLLRVRARNAAARYGNWMRETTQPGALLAAAAFDDREDARRAYLGFAETAWVAAPADVDKLLLGTLDWLQRRPLLMKAAWPYPHQAALLLEMDTEDKFENSLRFAALLERYRLRGTFYSLTSEAARFPEVVKRLAARHEIAYHADVHDGFAKLAPGRQDARLKAMIKQMKNLLSDVRVASGFRAPLEEYDATTERLLRANGLRHHAASPNARDDVLPGFSTAEEGLPADKALVVLPRTWLDDMNLRKSSRLDPAAAAEMVLMHLDDTVAMRGLGLLSIHTQEFYAGSAVERATTRLLAELPKHGPLLWTAPAESIVRWWRGREAAQVSSREEPGRLRVTINAARAVQALQLVLIPPGPGEPRLEAPALQARLEKLDQHRYAIVLPAVPAGKSELSVAF